MNRGYRFQALYFTIFCMFTFKFSLISWHFIICHTAWIGLPRYCTVSYLIIVKFKGSVKRKQRWVKISTRYWVYAGTEGLDIIFAFLLVVFYFINNFFFSGQCCPSYRRVRDNRWSRTTDAAPIVLTHYLIFGWCSIALCAYRQSRANSQHERYRN
jgi:hypothetical protein